MMSPAPLLLAVLSSSALLFGACEREVRLGLYAVDGSIDPADGSVDGASATSFQLQYGPLVGPDCDGSLATLGSAFADWTANTAGFVTGPVELVFLSEGLVRVTGEPIAQGYGAISIQLEHDIVPTQPSDVLAAILPVIGPAPEGMLLDAAMFSIDTSSMTSSRIYGQAGRLYLPSANSDGSCALTFELELSAL